MLKVLLKKQFLSVVQSLGGRKSKKQMTPVTYLLCSLGITLIFAISFFSIAKMFAAGFVATGFGELYFVFIGFFATMLAVIGSIFMTHNQLYEAKDNDLLLSMPIPPRYILFVRMLVSYLQNFLMVIAIFIPSYIAYAQIMPITAVQIVIWVLNLFVQPFLALFITCILGFLLSLITSKMRDKTLVSVIVTVIFLAAYFASYYAFMGSANVIFNKAGVISDWIESNMYPLFKFGAGCLGDFVGFLVSFILIGVLFVALYAVLAKTYIKLITTKKGNQKVRKIKRDEKISKPITALLKKEARHFFGSSIYVFNSSFGVILMIIATIVIPLKKDVLNSLFDAIPVMKSAISGLLCLSICVLAIMDEVSAPSISLEGKTLWILQSTPIEMWDVLKVKLLFHYLVSAPIATVCMVVFACVFTPSALMIILMLLLPSVIVTLSGILGLLFNLKKPVLNWENETIVIKQSMSVLFTMLSSMFAILILGAIFLGLSNVISADLSLLVAFIIIAAITVGLLFVLKKKGSEMLKNLT